MFDVLLIFFLSPNLHFISLQMFNTIITRIRGRTTNKKNTQQWKNNVDNGNRNIPREWQTRTHTRTQTQTHTLYMASTGIVLRICAYKIVCKNVVLGRLTPILISTHRFPI